MSFAENTIKSLSFQAFYFHIVVSTTSAFDMERYHALTMLTLDASTFFDSADNTLETEAFVINFI